MKQYKVKSYETVYQTYEQEVFAENEEQAKEKADKSGKWGEPIDEQGGGDREIEVEEIEQRKE